MKRHHIFVYLLACGFLHGQNVVTEWAEIVQPAINTPPKSPAIQHIMRATIHIAMYDAAVAVAGDYTPFASTARARPGADIRAAVATAAYRAARPFVDPSRAAAFEAQYEAYMAAIPAGDAKTNGVLAGQNAAAAIQASRAGDGMNDVVLYECSTINLPVGQFEPDAGCGTQPVSVNVGQIKPFTFSNPSRFRPTGPDPMTSPGYTADFIETRDYGRFDSSIRTAEQTDIAYFWQASIATIHQDLVNLAVSRRLSVPDASRFFAMIYTAAADSGIVGFETKYYYHLWRPRVAIPKADLDGNPDTAPDASWRPLINVNHPEYPSGHAFVTGAITDAMARFFGTARITWTLTATRAGFPQLVKAERTYTDLTTLIREMDNARVWAGLHWRHSMYHGADIARQVARHVCDNFFQPVR
ncbi:MAG: vanadium-dependent haloperoxidase [Acidobacteria bacterium]|nr:vanadium-dependent haloperoxidase [Acidobacteriota bacterium]